MAIVPGRISIEAAVYPKLYLGSLPEDLAARRALRDWALRLQADLRRRDENTPCYLLLHFTPGERGDVRADLLLLRPESTIVGVVEPVDGPADILADGRWIDRMTGEERRDAAGRSPLERARRLRAITRARLQEDDGAGGEPERLVGALICRPAMHPETRVALDIDDHRNQIKVAGLDELAALSAMLRTSAPRDDATLRAIIVEIFGGVIWHDGERQLFELAESPFQLRWLRDGRPDRVLPLLVGENSIGRRRGIPPGEHRLTIPGDDLVSNDHAVLTVSARRVLVRDQSTNGTWIAPPNAAEQRLHHSEGELPVGAELRMGLTRLLLEQVEPELPAPRNME